MIWGFLIVIPGTLCQVSSIAEMASVQPIAGAQVDVSVRGAQATLTYAFSVRMDTLLCA